MTYLNSCWVRSASIVSLMNPLYTGLSSFLMLLLELLVLLVSLWPKQATSLGGNLVLETSVERSFATYLFFWASYLWETILLIVLGFSRIFGVTSESLQEPVAFHRALQGLRYGFLCDLPQHAEHSLRTWAFSNLCAFGRLVMACALSGGTGIAFHL